MRSFWIYITNGKYYVGCSGATVYVYDMEGRELARFRDIPYGYNAMFCPNTNIIAVKSTDSYLGFYNLDTLKLEKKIRVGVNGRKSPEPQDCGFCFSPDGERFFNIELNSGQVSHIVVYDMNTFEETERYTFEDSIVLEHIEFSEQHQCYLILALSRDEDLYYFVAKLCDGRLIEERKLPYAKAEYLNWYKHVEISGFTKKKINLYFENQKVVYASLEQAYNGELSDEAVMDESWMEDVDDNIFEDGWLWNAIKSGWLEE